MSKFTKYSIGLKYLSGLLPLKTIISKDYYLQRLLHFMTIASRDYLPLGTICLQGLLPLSINSNLSRLLPLSTNTSQDYYSTYGDYQLSELLPFRTIKLRTNNSQYLYLSGMFPLRTITTHHYYLSALIPLRNITS